MTETTEGIEDLVFDKKERDIMINLLAHRFLKTDDEDWRIVKSRLIELYKIYYKTRAVRLCVECLTIYSSNRKMAHNNISVSSIFDQINPINASQKELIEFFAKNGRTKNDNEGNTLIGVPTFDHPCLPIYRFLDGSSIPKRFAEKQMETEGREFKVQEPMVILSTTEKIVVKQKEKNKLLCYKQLKETQKKKGSQIAKPDKIQRKESKLLDTKGPEQLFKREPERKNAETTMQKKKLNGSDIKNSLKSPMKPPFVVPKASGHLNLFKRLMEKLNC